MNIRRATLNDAALFEQCTRNLFEDVIATTRDPLLTASAESFITNWMSMLDGVRDALVEEHGGKATKDLLPALEREAVRTSLTNLRTFPCVQILESKGRLHLHGAHFDIATGTLEVLDRETNKFVPL